MHSGGDVVPDGACASETESSPDGGSRTASRRAPRGTEGDPDRELIAHQGCTPRARRRSRPRRRRYSVRGDEGRFASRRHAAHHAVHVAEPVRPARDRSPPPSADRPGRDDARVPDQPSRGRLAAHQTANTACRGQRRRHRRDRASICTRPQPVRCPNRSRRRSATRSVRSASSPRTTAESAHPTASSRRRSDRSPFARSSNARRRSRAEP